MDGPLTSNEQIFKVIKSPPAQNTWLEIKTAFTKFYPKSRTEVALRSMKLSLKARTLRMQHYFMKNELYTFFITRTPFFNNNKKSFLSLIGEILKNSSDPFLKTRLNL